MNYKQGANYLNSLKAYADEDNEVRYVLTPTIEYYDDEPDFDLELGGMDFQQDLSVPKIEGSCNIENSLDDIMIGLKEDYESILESSPELWERRHEDEQSIESINAELNRDYELTESQALGKHLY